ncbi:hypothetical protein FO013_13005 [Brevibacterium aurantiacum]|uniref:Sialidase domain-containing protein n=1 Tax=Brevibacterium aurantiacum TaxID=273384 RepID=A0A556CCC6_BREAU|nr:hypothetical protein FO013_13005 [Brevibacterium aurantiacum]
MNLLANERLEHVSEPPADGRLRYFDDSGNAAAVIPTDRRSNHAPSVLALRDGTLLAAWFGGSDEGNKDIDVLVSRFDSNAATWSASAAVTHDEIRSDQNPGLFEAPDGQIWLVYTSQLSRQSGVPETFNLQHTSVVKVIRSADGGKNWSQPQTLFDRQGTFCRQPIQVLSDGRWVHPQWLCFDDDSKNGSDQPVLQISEDEGSTWHQIEFPDASGRSTPMSSSLSPGAWCVCSARASPIGSTSADPKTEARPGPFQRQPMCRITTPVSVHSFCLPACWLWSRTSTRSLTSPPRWCGPMSG